MKKLKVTQNQIERHSIITIIEVPDDTPLNFGGSNPDNDEFLTNECNQILADQDIFEEVEETSIVEVEEIK